MRRRSADRFRAIVDPCDLAQHAPSSPDRLWSVNKQAAIIPGGLDAFDKRAARSLVPVTDDGAPRRTYGWRHGP
jgi:hypothetical protein